MQLSATIQQRVHAFLAGNPDEAILRWIFPQRRHAVTIVVLAVDLAGMNGWIGTPDSAAELTAAMRRRRTFPTSCRRSWRRLPRTATSA